MAEGFGYPHDDSQDRPSIQERGIRLLVQMARTMMEYVGWRRPQSIVSARLPETLGIVLHQRHEFRLLLWRRGAIG